MAQTKRNQGRLIALIVAIVILAALVHLAVANYFLRARLSLLKSKTAARRLLLSLHPSHRYQAREEDGQAGPRGAKGMEQSNARADLGPDGSITAGNVLHLLFYEEQYENFNTLWG